MLFNSLTFVVFFVVVVVAYWSIRSWNARKNLLVIASYIFYGAWNPPFAALLFSTTAMDFWLGRQMSRANGRHSRRAWLVASVCMNLSMLGILQIRELSAGKFPVAARSHRHHLSAAASGHSSAGRHFLLHVSLSLLHARHLSRRPAAYQVVARFRSGRFVFSSAGRRTNCPCRRFSSATCQPQPFARGPVFLGIIADDPRPVRKNRSRRYDAFRLGRSHLWLRWPTHRARFLAGCDGIRRPDLL